MGKLPSARKKVDIPVSDPWHGFMKGDYSYFRNESKESWENNLLQRAAITTILSESNFDRTMLYFSCFKLKYTHSAGLIRGKPTYCSFCMSLDDQERCTLEIRNVKSEYNWYVDMPMKQQLELGADCSVKLEKCGNLYKRVYKGKVYETLSYGFRFMPDNEVKGKLVSAANQFARQLLGRYENLLLRYVAQIKAYMDRQALGYKGFTEFDYYFEPLAILIDSTGVYVKYDDRLPNECQFQQLGLPKLSIIQQYGMGLAIRSLLEKVTRENPTRMNDGTSIFHSLDSLYYRTLDYYTYTGQIKHEHKYIGWIGYVRSLPVQNMAKSTW